MPVISPPLGRFRVTAREFGDSNAMAPFVNGRGSMPLARARRLPLATKATRLFSLSWWRRASASSKPSMCASMALISWEARVSAKRACSTMAGSFFKSMAVASRPATRRPKAGSPRKNRASIHWSVTFMAVDSRISWPGVSMRMAPPLPEPRCPLAYRLVAVANRRESQSEKAMALLVLWERGRAKPLAFLSTRTLSLEGWAKGSPWTWSMERVKRP